MAELKTKPTKVSVENFLNKITDKQKREDAFELLKIFKTITKEEPIMWGPSIIGFGTYHYKLPKTNREGDWMRTGFSPRAANLTLYIMPGFDKFPKQMAKLGKFSTGKSCLYIKKLADIDVPTLKELIKEGYKKMDDYDHAT